MLHRHICCLKPRVSLPAHVGAFSNLHLLVGEKEGRVLRNVASGRQARQSQTWRRPRQPDQRRNPDGLHGEVRNGHEVLWTVESI